MKKQNDSTDEQLRVAKHSMGRHARVLAVAGSGKTYAMVERVRFLVGEQRIDPSKILILMFNRRARDQFEEKLTISGIPPEYHPKVYTFHSFAYQFINRMVKQGLVGRFELWSGDNSELARIEMKKVLSALKLTELVDVEEAETAISLWKNSLIPPDRAGCESNPLLPEVYREFERNRKSRGGLTFDDFLPIAVGILENDQDIQLQWSNRMDHVIVDEYQDVNIGQQKLIEIVSGSHADVMVVGDDDQTIYEWRGARPSFIVSDFEQNFANKKVDTYYLTHTFRFGPELAQSAQNSISHNLNREEKYVIAHDSRVNSFITLVTAPPEQSVVIDKEMAERIRSLLESERVPAKEIIVLCRMFSQLDSLQAECFRQRIPFRVEGAPPFYERREIQILTSYLHLSLNADTPLTKDLIRKLLFIVNVPSRKIPREAIEHLAQDAKLEGQSYNQFLETIALGPKSSLFSSQQRDRTLELQGLTWRIREELHKNHDSTAGDVLAKVANLIKLDEYLANYYGAGVGSADRIAAVRQFLDYAIGTGLAPREFLSHMALLDATQGRPADEQILMTSIYRTKGLEFDYVFIPNCVEGSMPCLKNRDVRVFDTRLGPKSSTLSNLLEMERRMFYVGVTRARRAVFIGTYEDSERGEGVPAAIPSRFLEEVQLDSTKTVMSRLSAFAGGENDHWPSLVTGIRLHSDAEWIHFCIRDQYLKRICSLEQMAEVDRLLMGKQPIPFAYTRDYPGGSEIVRKTEERELKPAWWDLV